MIAFELDCISLGIELAESSSQAQPQSSQADHPAPLQAESHSSLPSSTTSSSRRSFDQRPIIDSSVESIVAFVKCIQSALAMLEYICKDMKGMISSCQGFLNTGLVAGCVWLAKVCALFFFLSPFSPRLLLFLLPLPLPLCFFFVL